MMKGISLAVKKTSDAVITAGEVAELGAIKPDGFGSLIKQRLSSQIAQPRIDALYLTEFPQLNTRLNLFGLRAIKENPYLSLRYNDISKDCAEYLCDYGITPWAWQDANSEQRLEMLCQAAGIIGKELNLPEDWIKGIKPVAVSGEAYKVQAVCDVAALDNGGVAILGIPALKINLDYLTDDYVNAMGTIYHEMIHMKQYASIDGIAPGATTDSRLFDLIIDLKTNHGTPESRVSYLYSPYEVEAWAQEAYFQRMLSAVILDRYS